MIDPVATLVSHRVGLLRGITVLRSPDAAPWFRASGTVCDLPSAPGFAGGGPVGGMGRSSEEALRLAAFEGVERYCGAWATPTRRGGPAPDSPFVRHQLFSVRQYAATGFPYASLRSDSVIRWVAGTRLRDGARIEVPQLRVQVPFHVESRDEALGPSVSTGLAAGPSATAAIHSALLEIAERDAFAIAWHHQWLCTRLRPRPGSPLAKTVAMVCRNRPRRVVFLDLEHDLRIPVVAAALFDGTGSDRRIAFGASANPDRAVAADKALREAVSECARLRSEHRRGISRAYKDDGSDVNEFSDHGSFYAPRRRQGVLESWLTGPERWFESDEGGATSAELPILDRFLRRGLDPIAVRCTTPDIAGLGLEVWRVVVPGAVSLAPSHSFPMLGASRRWTVASDLGRPIRWAAPSFPHPFS